MIVCNCAHTSTIGAPPEEDTPFWGAEVRARVGVEDPLECLVSAGVLAAGARGEVAALGVRWTLRG